jgi:hypothetical protein
VQSIDVPTSGARVLTIAKDEGEIARLIRSNRSYCKVLLKTADDPILLPIWYAHYTKLFNPDQIIIADNGSADPAVISFYNKTAYGSIVFSYAGDNRGYHNNIHDRSKFKTFYEAVSASCNYLISVDTDELLYIADDNTWSLDRTKCEKLLNQAEGKAVSTTWVYTKRGSVDTFYIGGDPQKLAWDLRWGKPFVPSSFAEGGVRIHNTQFPQQMFDPELGANFFLLHLVYYSREQRLRIDKRKLIARGAAKEEDTVEEIIARDYAKFRDPTINRVVAQMSTLLGETWSETTGEAVSGACVRYAPGGRVEYGNHDATAAMADFRGSFRRFFKEGFEPKA